MIKFADRTKDEIIHAAQAIGLAALMLREAGDEKNAVRSRDIAIALWWAAGIDNEMTQEFGDAIPRQRSIRKEEAV
jgi:hypothetical protein